MADERNSHLLYLVRHGQARTQGDDADRTLTDQGQDEIEMIARWAAGSGVEPAQIRHSGKRRAEQTATILQDRLSADEGVVVGVGLSPNDDVRLVAETLESEQRTLMLVGHLPFLSRLISLLLLNDADRELIDFPTGAMACLLRKDENWRLAWLVTPELSVRPGFSRPSHDRLKPVLTPTSSFSSGPRRCGPTRGRLPQDRRFRSCAAAR